MGEIRIERAGDAEFERTVEIFAAVHPSSGIGASEARSYEQQVRDFTAWIAYLDEASVAAAHAAVESGSEIPAAALYVLREGRGHGVGTRLYETISSWARERDATELRSSVDEDDADSLAWVQRRGFVEVSRESYLDLDLTATAAPGVEPPAGVEITPWAERPELVHGLYEVAREAWEDIPGQDREMSTFDEWLRNDMQSEGDRADATFVAVAGDEVVGYAKFSLSTEDTDVGWHDLTGVRRAWRGRGVARALKHAQIAWAKEQGYKRLRTANEVRNEPIRRLNERLGYRPAPGRILVRGPIAP